jgi:hypothetical protein
MTHIFLPTKDGCHREYMEFNHPVENEVTHQLGAHNATSLKADHYETINQSFSAESHPFKASNIHYAFQKTLVVTV